MFMCMEHMFGMLLLYWVYWAKKVQLFLFNTGYNTAE